MKHLTKGASFFYISNKIQIGKKWQKIRIQ